MRIKLHKKESYTVSYTASLLDGVLDLHEVMHVRVEERLERSVIVGLGTRTKLVLFVFAVPKGCAHAIRAEVQTPKL